MKRIFKIGIVLVSLAFIGGIALLIKKQVLHKELYWEWVVRPEKYTECFLLGEKLVAVKKENGRYGIIAENGEYAWVDEYDKISRYTEGSAVVQKNGKYSYIDNHGKRVIEGEFEGARNFYESKAAVKVDGLWGFINQKGETIIAPSYNQVGNFNENYASVEKDGLWGFVNSEGDIAVTCQYDEVRNFQEGLAVVRDGEFWGVINGCGEVIAPFQYDYVSDYSEGYAAVERNNKWGYINPEGRICIELKYDAAGDFSESRAAVLINDYINGYMDAWAYIDEKDNIQIDFYPYAASEGRMLYVGKFQNGLAFVSDDMYCIMDYNGKYVFDGHESDFFISSLVYNEKYDAIPAYIYTDELMTEKKYGLVGMDGRERMEPIFDYVHGIEDNYVLVSNIVDGQWRYGVIKIVNR